MCVGYRVSLDSISTTVFIILFICCTITYHVVFCVCTCLTPTYIFYTCACTWRKRANVYNCTRVFMSTSLVVCARTCYYCDACLVTCCCNCKCRYFHQADGFHLQAYGIHLYGQLNFRGSLWATGTTGFQRNEIVPYDSLRWFTGTLLSYMYVYMNIYTCLHICMYVYVHIYIYVICVHIYIYTYARVMCICICTCYVSMYVCVCKPCISVHHVHAHITRTYIFP